MRVHAYILKGKRFWAIQPIASSSWNWCKVLKLKPLARKYIQMVIGEEQRTHLWYDWWHPLGPLLQVFPDRIIHLFRSFADPKVSSIIQNGEWVWSSGRTYTGEVAQLVNATPPSLFPMPDQIDTAVWTADSKGCYTASSAFKVLTTLCPSVSWSKLVWEEQHVLRHSFILWLACQNRLSTKDRLLEWGMLLGPYCTLCSAADESIELLFSL